jgi:hypothetical protein
MNSLLDGWFGRARKSFTAGRLVTIVAQWIIERR